MGLPEHRVLRLEAYAGVPSITAAVTYEDGADPRSEFFQLQGSEFRRTNRPFRNPDDYFDDSPAAKAPDGSFLFRAYSRRDRNHAYYKVSPTGAIHRKIIFDDAFQRYDVATNRIFKLKDRVLLEWDGSSFVTSDLYDKAIGTKISSYPKYEPALKAWLQYRGKSSRFAKPKHLWMRFDGQKTWHYVDRIKTFRNDPNVYQAKLLLDKTRNLAILHIDVTVLVFDLSGPKPAYLYQRTVREGTVAQAGNGGVMVQPTHRHQDIAWFGKAPNIRVLTRDGAVPIQSEPEIDIRADTLSVGIRRSNPRFHMLNNIIKFSDSVVVQHDDGFALFDGTKLTNRPDLGVLFEKYRSWPDQGTFGDYVRLSDGLYEWKNKSLKPVLTSDGDIMKASMHFRLRGFGFDVFQNDERIYIKDIAQNMHAVTHAVGTVKFAEIIPVPFKKAVLARYRGQGLFLYQPCSAKP